MKKNCSKRPGLFILISKNGKMHQPEPESPVFLVLQLYSQTASVPVPQINNQPQSSTQVYYDTSSPVNNTQIRKRGRPLGSKNKNKI